MSKFGMVMDYVTGEPVREATADEWLLTARQLGRQRSDGYTGAWRDSEDNRAYWVEGGPDTVVTFAQVFALGLEAHKAGDNEMSAIAGKALMQDDSAAWDECREVILNTRIEMA